MPSVKHLHVIDFYYPRDQNYTPEDGKRMCQAIAAVFPNLGRLVIQSIKRTRLDAIKPHLRLLGKCKCRFFQIW